ncbi:FtsK/SpoIIIE domain-containing protein [uncultured Nocardioides sp.]|uniref:FtsK/SpoIIIE domain-containing protein n=1 Tax=uncultured Nocardioides sp. TaxID=198441 RepID=UPI00262C0BD6|nr:FtsK/SpoIIIE domain-containing protein [uncultured Nocardioides sp.]
MPALDREAELLGLLEGGRHLLVLDGLERATRAYATDDDAFVSDIEVGQAPKELWDLGGAALTDQSLSRSEQLRRLADDALGSFLKDLAALSGAKTLISTRNPVFDLEWRSGLPIEGVETLRIRGLSSDAAATLWKEITGTTASAPVLETLASVDNHPLFVRLLGAEVAQYRPAPGNFAAWQEGHPDFDPIGVLANDTRKRHILRFAMSGLDELQRAVLTGIAHASRPVAFAEIDSAILPALSGPRGPSRSGRLSDVLRSLEDRALIGWDRAGNKYDAHPIVRGVVRSLTGFQAATSQRADATIYRGTDVGLPERAPAPEAPAYVDGLPTSCRLVDVLGLTEITPQAITQGWRSGTGSPSAVIGVTESGVLELDLRGPAHGPNAHGPHGLIGGTTGSGKSELLQTIITSLALVNSPDYMNFLLVDYKGGAAFKTCSELPHTVGLVTELDSHLAERLVSSLYGELRRREEILRRNNAHDIDEYLAQRGFGQPLPRLVVVIDEFASLVRDVPEFIQGTLDIARLGRSLGIHLLLGTQRPSGVISPQLSANTELRIALRTADATDSADVIGVPDAADLPRSAPGRALLRGVGGPLFAFQTARVGGHGPGVDPFSNEPTDLDLLASAITEAAAGIRPPRQPWLPPLPETVTLDQVAAAFPDSVPHSDDGAVPIGLADLPQQQRREAFRFNVRRCGHLEVISGARAGRSNVLIVLAAAIGRWLSPATAHLYIADLDTGRLRHLRSLPHVGGFVGPYDPQGLKDLSRTLIQIIEERRDRATSAGVDEDRLMPWIRDQDLPSVIVLVDGIERIMNDTSETGQTDVAEAWTRILRTGANVGVSVVLTGEPDVLRSRLSAGMNDKLLLRMPDTLTFLQLGLRRTNIPRHMPEGRAFNDMGCEIQIAVLAEDPSTDSQAGALSRLSTAARARWADVPPEKLPRPIS